MTSTEYDCKHYADALTWIEHNLEWWLKRGAGAPDGIVLVARALSETEPKEEPGVRPNGKKQNQNVYSEVCRRNDVTIHAYTRCPSREIASNSEEKVK